MHGFFINPYYLLMKVGIYLDGLGQSVAQESVLKFATRLKNEYSYHTTGVSYDLTVEKVNYNQDQSCNMVSIVQKKDNASKVLYKLYEFKYGDILTGEFNKKNILLKNLLLLTVVMQKLPLLIKRFFIRKGYNRPFQTFYLFLLFLLLATAVLLTLPATINLLSEYLFSKQVVGFVHRFDWMVWIARKLHITAAGFKHFSEITVSLTAIVLLLMPQANVVITSLATEFVCAHFYLAYGQRKQDILGNLDQLVEYIVETEKEPKLHFHSYSFGSLVAIDYLFTFGRKPTGNMPDYTEALITIGTPFDFINAYYPYYYDNRNAVMEDGRMTWINVYSIADALASNFRKDGKIDEAEYGIRPNGLKPINVNYEVVRVGDYNFWDFLFLSSVKVHGMYWTPSPCGQSCLGPLFNTMREKDLLPIA
jgi:hypothetical protein